ncbi:sulfite reductase (NADPH) alpha subunit [Tangfeifania diversioriginum]|uniref:assimilatory sulfite reductase (NADPH) n=1 Tax=Tangfeifania diversioriginum TaxID=1168035 RepID=A0A1M6B526_9BACT|nr:flavodoxin domain-containing protein [Tangfeifania diversioriginum]SHI43805.1 sulfite reductase (NADPH) alpha subunit [Tangfeifania diversioriginum]
MEATVQNISETTRLSDKKVNADSILHIIYGSRTGNSKAAATLAWEYALYLGLDCRLHDMKTFVHEKIGEVKNLLIAVSTHGDGDPPAVVEDFYNFIHSSQVPSMKGVKFSVLALGDSSYKDFCKTGRDFRERLLELGANEVSPLVECDIDYEENAKDWVADAVLAFEKILPKKEKQQKKGFAFEINKRELDEENAFYATVTDKQLLTAPGYDKKIWHFSLSMKGFGTDFFPGDSFGVYTTNSMLFVDKFLRKLRFDGTHPVKVDGKTKLLKEALVNDFEITVVTPLVVKKYAELVNNDKLTELVASENKLNEFCGNHDVLDLLSQFPGDVSPTSLLSVLRKLTPRLYSVASSPLVYPDELHLTAGVVEYNLNERNHKGVCSVYLDERVEVGDAVPVFREPNEIFRLPEDGNTPVIMIAAGTGIAPFRGFLQEREHKGAKGKNWLFFGGRHADGDFLYRDEMIYFHQSGLLTKMDLTFSRDQSEKKYVQHALLENSSEFFKWIDREGAIIYLCGNKRTMGEDVKKTIKKIIATEGGLSDFQADEYLLRLIKEHRLLSDLY